MINPIGANNKWKLKQQKLSYNGPNDTLVNGMATSSLYTPWAMRHISLRKQSSGLTSNSFMNAWASAGSVCGGCLRSLMRLSIKSQQCLMIFNSWKTDCHFITSIPASSIYSCSTQATWIHALSCIKTNFSPKAQAESLTIGSTMSFSYQFAISDPPSMTCSSVRPSKLIPARNRIGHIAWCCHHSSAFPGVSTLEQVYHMLKCGTCSEPWTLVYASCAHVTLHGPRQIPGGLCGVTELK